MICAPGASLLSTIVVFTQLAGRSDSAADQRLSWDVGSTSASRRRFDDRDRRRRRRLGRRRRSHADRARPALAPADLASLAAGRRVVRGRRGGVASPRRCRAVRGAAPAATDADQQPGAGRLVAVDDRNRCPFAGEQESAANEVQAG